jgi:hypothetical protein
MTKYKASSPPPKEISTFCVFFLFFQDLWLARPICVFNIFTSLTALAPILRSYVLILFSTNTMVSTRSGGAPPSGSTTGPGTPFEQPDISDPSRNARQDSEETFVGDQPSNQPLANNRPSLSRSWPPPAFTKAQRDELFAIELRIKQA